MSIVAAPSATFEAVCTGFASGLTGTIGVRLLDNAGATTTARVTAGIAEYPAGSGVYYVTMTAPSDAGQYAIMWDTGTVSPSTVAIEDLLVSSSYATLTIGDTYATVEELFRILKIRTPSAEQTAAAERVLATASGEIDSEIDLADDADALAGWQLSLTAEVCLERAVEHWRQQESPFGLIGLGGEVGAGVFAGRDSWERHALKLAPLKTRWGLA